MFPIHLIRFAQALVVSALLALFVVPALALGATGAPAADSFERYAAAHPFGNGTPAPALDAIERYAAAHPFGVGTPAAPAPDAFERYVGSHQTVPLTDGRSPDTRDAAEAARLQSTDLRSPDTRDLAEVRRAALQSQTVAVADPAQRLGEVVESGGFAWRDAAVGAGAALGLILLIGLGGLSLRQRGRGRVLVS
jgi:hypothetical protein